MRRTLVALPAGLLALALTAPVAAQDTGPDPTVDEIVASYVEAIGGLELNQSFTSRETRASMTVKGMGAPWRVTTIQKAPDKSYSLVEIAGYGEITMGCDGEVAWEKEPAKAIREIKGTELLQKLRDADFDWMTELIVEGALTYEGREVDDLGAFYVLRGPFPPGHAWSGAEYTVHLDAQSYLPRAVGTSPTWIEMSDYETFDGVPTPLAVAITMGSDTVATMAVESVTHNVEVDDGLFAMPGRNLAVDYTPIERDGWAISTPEEEGLNPALVVDLYTDAAQMPKLFGVLVVKNGRLVAEEYFNGFGIDSLALGQSVAKSYNSALIGLAQRECGLSIDQGMMEFFPELADEITDSRKHEITVRQLLQMRSGYPWEEEDPALWEEFIKGDYIPFIEGVELVNDPGTEFHYSNFSSWLLGVIVARTCDADLKEFADANLFTPLGVGAGEWYDDPYGYYYSLFSFTPRDMARFGQLYLDGGVHEGRQVMPADWVDASLQVYSRGGHVTDSVGRYLGDLGYGYQWWSSSAGDHQFDMAWGHGGQYIVLLHELDMIIVVVGEPFFLQHDSESWVYEVANADLFAKFIASLPTGPVSE